MSPDFHKICHQSTPQRQTCVVVKTYIMMSHVGHSERGLSSLIASNVDLVNVTEIWPHAVMLLIDLIFLTYIN